MSDDDKALSGWSHRGINALEEAWGIIANASDWDIEGRQVWRTAAERFRDETWHPALRRHSRRRHSWRMLERFARHT